MAEFGAAEITERPKRRITLSSVMGWLWFLVSGIPGLMMLSEPGNVGAGTLFLVSAVVACPLVFSTLEKNSGVAVSGWLRFVIIIGALIGAGALIRSNVSGGDLTSTEFATTPSATASAARNEAVPEQAAMLTGPQKNAVRSAKQYLSFSGFSRDGLIEQLSSSAGDGYSVADATAAVDSLNVDWNENAAKSAKQYLSFSGFSCDGLIKQLSSSAGSKYTVSQATYGARQAGAC